MTMLSLSKFAKVGPRGRFIMKFDEFYQQLTDQLNQVTTGSDGISQEAAGLPSCCHKQSI
jgi:hypothetical protein